MNEFNHRKAVQALNFFCIRNGGEIEIMKAIKLLWLSDRIHLLKYGRMISNDTYFAMDYGPVPSSTKNIIDKKILKPSIVSYGDLYIEKNGTRTISSLATPDFDVFSDSDENILNLVYEKFGKKTSSHLSSFSHYFKEWSRHEEFFKKNSKMRMDIEFDDFFENSNILRTSGIDISDEHAAAIKQYYYEFA